MSKARQSVMAMEMIKQFWAGWVLLLAFLILPVSVMAEVCATVKIEIRQELTLERQAFDAHMRINNDLTHITLEDINIEVLFTGENGDAVLATSDPDNTDALFFIWTDSMDNIDDISGYGQVAPASSADIHWLIIPSPGSANEDPHGTLYYVGARLTYNVGGEESVTEITPDYIFVKPLPELTLDYFFPRDVYADDPFTTEIEPPELFSLGARVQNNGHGVARNLRIESAQPEIVENDLGLFIDFVIQGSQIGLEPAENTLLINFGDIEPNTSKMAKWLMATSLSGRFVEFDAEFTHSDELGGTLTSLIEAVNTHMLVREVLVDVAGRDLIYDFLALDGDVYRVYESNGPDTAVIDHSAVATLEYTGQNGGERHYNLATPVTAGFMVIRLEDPENGQRLLTSTVRSDGKQIKPENIWLSKTQNEDHTWSHWVYLFDANTPGTYTLTYENVDAVPQPPVIQFIPDRTVTEGNQVSFVVEASDPNGTIPSLTAAPLPAGANFTDSGNGTAIFDWTPQIGQAGQYPITFTALDNQLTAMRQAVIAVCSVNDTDCDNLPDAWEMTHFGNLDHDGTGDTDGDGLTDYEEYLYGTDPNAIYHGPSVPGILSPVDGAAVDTLQPTLSVANSTGSSGEILYTFELYADAARTQLVVTEEDLSPGVDNTQWVIPVELQDNTYYYWRVRASDGLFRSLWADGSFIVNTTNDPPAPFSISYPADTAHVDTVTPTLEVVNVVDPDNDLVFYNFAVFVDAGMTEVIAPSPNIVQGDEGVTTWALDTLLTDGEIYTWQVTATDIHGDAQPSAAAVFTVNLQNQAPSAPQINSPNLDEYFTSTSIDLSVLNTTDADGDILTYRFELDTTPAFDSPMLRVLEETAEGTTTTTWPVANLTDDSTYFWRVRATDGNAVSRWARGSFFVNFQDETPLTPVIRNPGVDAVVGTPTPTLRIYPGSNPEKDLWVYRYEIYEREDLGPRVALGEAPTPYWQVFPALDDRGTYWWRVQVEDTQGRISPWSQPVAFRVDVDGVNEPPLFMFEEPSTSTGTTDAMVSIRWADWDTDDDARIALYHDTNRSGANGELIVVDLSEGSEGVGDTYSWNISGLSEGTYYIYAVITDDDNTTTTYAPGAVTILPGTIDDTSPTVQITPPAGSFTASQSITITADEPADIYYTLDGSEPTTDSTLYTEPIVISQDTTMKCLAVDPAGNVSVVVTETYMIGADELSVQMSTSKGRQLSGVRVYAFTESGTYTGLSGTTDSAGTATFNPTDFSEGSYKFRVDYLGNQFWSDVVSMPGTAQLDVVIEEETAEVTVTIAGTVAAGIRVYLFSTSGAYLGIYQVTNENGNVSFDLPTGPAFSFRADILSGQYWSHANEIVPGGPNEINVDAGGGRLQVRIQEDVDTPMAAIRAYLFTAGGSYLGQNQTSDEAGNVFFDVPAGDFAVRIDYLGDQFWTEDIMLTIDTTIALSIVHQDITVTVDTIFVDEIQSLPGVRVYLFSETGTYLGQYQTSDVEGKTTFHLPQKPYKVRADYLGKQYWPEVFTWTDPAVRLAMADAEITVTGAGSPLANRNVYVFALTGSYLGLTQATDSNGQVFFRLPEGSYKFRIDHQGSQYWSGEELLTAHGANPVGISTGGGSYTVTAQKGPGEPLVGVNGYVFSDADVYLGLYGATDSRGQVSFDLAGGLYKFRIDYLGYQFWSDVADVPNDLTSDVTINHETVEVSVTSASVPAVGTNVYLFSESGAYLGQFKETDTDGQVSYSLPVDRTFQYRADIMGDHYWSDLSTVTTGGPNTVAIDAGGGTWQVTIQEQPDVSLAGINVYLFSQTGSYLGVSQTADAAGLAVFMVPQGTYKVRADYLGYQFWSPDTLISENTDMELDIAHQQAQITVTGILQGTAEPLAGVRVYLFSSTDTYLGFNEITDADGKVTFNLPQKDFKVRVDYLAEQYWSDPFSWEDTTVDITISDSVVTITGGGFPQAGVNVYAFSATGTFLGFSEATDSGGEVSFRLPVDSYKFRADYQGNQYWSAVEVIEAGNPNTIIISAGGGSFTFTVESAPGEALAGAKCYVFNGTGTYLGMFGATDTEGKVFFDLADGDFRFRVDHLGYQFWSDVYTVPNVLTGSLNLGQKDVIVTVEGLYQTTEPLEGVRVYLFTPGGSYLGQYFLTDVDGQLTFNLPDQPYKIRVGYLGNQFWSDDFQQQDTTVTINQGKADIHVHRSGSNVEGARVYLFSDSDIYLGRHETTTVDGGVEFVLPDRIFKFRVDEGADQVWSQVIDIQAGTDTSVEIDLN